jgi:hypothetical protein
MVQTGAVNDKSTLPPPVVIRVDEVNETSREAVRTLIDIDLQTFSEPTFSATSTR